MTDKLSTETIEALSALLTSQPFFASYFYDRMTLTEDESCPTASVNGNGAITVGPWFRKLTIQERVFVLAHEVFHKMMQHMPRAKLYTDLGMGPDMLPFSFKKWNMAADYIINATLTEDGIGKMPNEGLINPSKYDSSSLCDDVYKEMTEEEEEGGGGKSFDEHEMGDELPSEADAADNERAITAAVSQAKATGKMPGAASKLVDQILNPKVSWGDKLKKECIAAMGMVEQSWSRPNRRKLAWSAASGQQQPMAPGSVRKGCGTVVCQIDTSGSISTDEISQCLGEVKGIVQDANPAELYILWVDAKVAHVDLLEQMADLDEIIARVVKDGAPGGGGTDMCQGFEYVGEWGINPAYMITLTDGYTGWPSGKPAFPHITVCTTDKTCPFGETIKLED